MHDRILRRGSTYESVFGVPGRIFELESGDGMSSLVSSFFSSFFFIPSYLSDFYFFIFLLHSDTGITNHLFCHLFSFCSSAYYYYFPFPTPHPPSSSSLLPPSSFLLPPLTTSATKESSIPTQAVHAQNAYQDFSKIKAPSQALHAKHARQDTTTPSQVPRHALISVASNHPIARTMNILT